MHYEEIVYFLKETNIPTGILGKALNTFFNPPNPQENFNLLKDRPSRISGKIYKRKRRNIVKILKRYQVEYDYIRLFFPHPCNLLSDVHGLCDSSIKIEKWKMMEKLRECFSVVEDYSRSKNMVHFKYRASIGTKTIKGHRYPQFRICHSTNEFANRNAYIWTQQELAFFLHGFRRRE